ncbi:MAG: hypothetical protein WDO15_21465 [Bacteroidota bacterium]
MLVLLFILFCFVQAQDSASNQPTTKRGRPIYFTFYGTVGIPINDFKNYSKVQGGGGLEFGIGFLDKKKSLSAGATLFVLSTGSKKDTYQGAEVKTSSALFLIGPMMRWAPVVSWRIVPFVSASAGVGISSTSTTSQIVDKATFIEQFTGMQESDIVTTTYQKDSGGYSLGYSLSAGILIKPAFILKFSYFGISKVKYVNKDDVTVENGELLYRSSVIP